MNSLIGKLCASRVIMVRLESITWLLNRKSLHHLTLGYYRDLTGWPCIHAVWRVYPLEPAPSWLPASSRPVSPWRDRQDQRLLLHRPMPLNPAFRVHYPLINIGYAALLWCRLAAVLKEVTSVVIHNFNILRTDPCPSETNVPLIVDADTEPISVFASEGFETIAGWNPQVTQSPGNLDLSQLAPCARFDACKSPDPGAFDSASVSAHLNAPIMPKWQRYMNNVKRE